MASSQKVTYNPVSPTSPETSPVSEPTFPSQAFVQRDDRLDSISLSARSDTPIVPPPSIPTTYPPYSSSSNAMASDDARRVQMPGPNYDAERAARPHFSPNESSSTQPHPNRPHSTRNPSWDLLSGIKRFEHGYEEFDSRNASEAHLAFADGDMPNNKVRDFPDVLVVGLKSISSVQIVVQILPLPFERFYRHSLVSIYCASSGDPLDTGNSGDHYLSQYASELTSHLQTRRIA